MIQTTHPHNGLQSTDADPTVIVMNHLIPHPAQMRTQYSLDGLAALALQIYQRGIDKWQPILASVTGDNGTHHIVSGHRRQTGLLLAWALTEWAADNPDSDVTFEVAQIMLNTLVDTKGSLEEAITHLLERFGDRKIEITPFSGTTKEEVLTLQAANYGGEAPDMLGIAHSFREAVREGATPAEIARNAGKKLSYVSQHLALTEINPDLAQYIAHGDLPLSAALAVADVPLEKRTGFTQFILANEPKRLTLKQIQHCAKTLKKWDGFPIPLTFPQQAQRNLARILNRLWSQIRSTNVEEAYTIASRFIYYQQHEAPWTHLNATIDWLHALGGDIYVQDGQIYWQQVVADLLPEISCQTCPIAQLPCQPLRSDIGDGRGDVLGMPCRLGEGCENEGDGTASQIQRCIHGLSPTDPFDVRVPWSWSDHEGVVHEGGGYRVKSLETLQAVWHIQLAQEQKEDDILATYEAEEMAQANEEDGLHEPSSAPSQPQTPIMKQRALIQDFMTHHTTLNVTHPFATQCGKCRHFLDHSPTKDAAVPHCAWAGRRRNVYFNRFQSTENEADAIPICRQFAPTGTWHDLIPPHPNAPNMPRDWMKTQLLLLVKDAGYAYGSSGQPFEFLTGRPMKSDESYGDWFAQQLDEQIGQLSDAQLWTLFIWATSEWQRFNNHNWLMPTDEKGVQFQTFRQLNWQLHTPEDDA